MPKLPNPSCLPTLLILLCAAPSSDFDLDQYGAVPELQMADAQMLVNVDDGRGTPYKVEKLDNICGLSEPRQLGHLR